VIKKGRKREAIETSNLAYLPQYDKFMGIEDKKEERLKMLLECVGSSRRMGWFGVAFVSKVLFDRVSVFTIQFAICASRILDQRMMLLTGWEQVLSAYG
jgi:hypothetical protein